jgi:hypothetical protein
MALRFTYSTAWGTALETAHDDYMDRLYGAVERFAGLPVVERFAGLPETPDGEPFCGCGECERRASWLFLMDRFITGWQDGSIQQNAGHPDSGTRRSEDSA